MKWAKLLAALGRIAAGLFVKNPKSQEKVESIGTAVDISIEAVGETIEADKKKE